MRLRIDPHVHSRLSDGTDSPRELLLRSRAAGLDVIGAVDHDTLDHWSEFRAAHQELLAAGENPPAVILGAEISASLDGVPVHLLAYLPDPKRGNLRRQLANAKSDRVERLQKMVEKIAVDYPITWQDVLDEVAGLMPGRPHLGDALVRKGYLRIDPRLSNRFSGHILRTMSGARRWMPSLRFRPSLQTEGFRCWRIPS